MNKKICFLYDSIFSIGGVQRSVSVISNELIEKGYDVTIICSNPNKIVDYDIYNLNHKIKIKFITISKLEKYMFFWTKIIYILIRKFPNLQKKTKLVAFYYYNKYFLYNNKLIKYINTNKIDVLVGVAKAHSILAGLLKSKISAKVIGWQHSSCKSYFVDKSRIYDQNELFKEILPRLDDYVVLTESDVTWIKNNFNYKARCIYNPKSFISKEVSKLDSKIFLAVGRFSEAKGFDRLIDSFNIFSKENKDWNLQIVGDGELKLKLEEKIKQYRLEDRITLIPKTNQIKEYYLNASIYLLTSYIEGQGIVLIEACECGLPIISYDIPSSVEQFSSCSLLVKNGDIKSYAKAMLDLVNNKEKRGELAKKAKLNAKKYDIDIIIKEWETIL